MRKQKDASTSKRSNLQGSKAARAKKGGQNQTKHRQTPVNKNKDKSSSQKHPYFSPNLSSILKNSESQYDDLQNEYYDHPLHSTAVFSGDLELNDEGNEKRDEDLAWSNMHKEPTWHSAPQGGKIRKEKRLEVPAHISEGVEPEESGKDTEVNNCEASSESTLKPVKKSQPEKVTVKKRSQARKFSNLSKDPLSWTSARKSSSDRNSRFKQRTLSAGATKRPLADTRASTAMQKKLRKQAGTLTDPRRDSVLTELPMDTLVRNDDKTSGQSKENTLGRTSIGSDASPNSSALRPATPEDRPLSLKIWCPEGVKRLSKDVTELDVVLNDFEQIVTEFKQSVEPFTSRKVVNRFFINLKEQVTETINQVQDLKSLQRKNAKVTSSFSKTRKHFLIVQKELNEQEVELKRLRKERAELSEKKTDLQHATQFLSGFKQLKTRYIEHRNKNPSETETYDISSFPALLVEARGILGAEKQLHLINTKIQQSLDKK
ncbi:centromere protein U [Hypanus sabinus]|uniref:centromere protein U n=1 Tax=Hypanus sabinus TaxID=79690 RepID=UPI0028C4DB7B|nr:centromere protein U [Hypanus sabinus]XP_059830347.1 centromere protein U [Hypanus sabinus]